VLPSSRSPNGEDQAETVLLHLITERGRPSVKIGSSEPTSDLSLAGPTGTKDTYVILQWRAAAPATSFAGVLYGQCYFPNNTECANCGPGGSLTTIHG
jgi:hypothetical protein